MKRIAAAAVAVTLLGLALPNQASAAGKTDRGVLSAMVNYISSLLPGTDPSSLIPGTDPSSVAPGTDPSRVKPGKSKPSNSSGSFTGGGTSGV